MKLALQEANNAYSLGEVPIGAVIVYNNKVISTGFNYREKSNNALYHAEIIAINKACNYMNSWRLIDCDIYVTVEPCPMCAGAIINSRIRNLIFGANDPKAGCCGSIINLFDLAFNHIPTFEGGILQQESSELLKSFFLTLRNNQSKPQ